MTRRLTTVIIILALMISAAAMITGCESSGEPFGTPLYIPREDPNINQGVVVTHIVVTPQGVNMAVGGMQQFKAIATYNTGITEDLTDRVEWYTESPGVGTFMSPAGRFLAKKPGVAVVRARYRVAQNVITSTAAWINSFYPNLDVPPATPLNPRAFVLDEGVSISWDINTTDIDLAGYNVWRTQVSSAHYSTDYGKVNPYPILYPPYLDKTVVSGWYYYRVTAEDTLGLMSPPSEEVAVFVTGMSHYGKSYDSGSSFNERGYKDSFSTAF